MSSKASVLAKELGSKGFEFNAGYVLSEGWNLGLSIVGWALLYAIMYYVMQSVAGFIPFIGPLGFGLVVGPSLSAGLLLFIHNKYTTGESDFGLVFKGFPLIGKLIVNSILVGLIMLGVMIPLGIISYFLIGADGFMDLVSIAQELNHVSNPMEIFSIVSDLLFTILPAIFVMSIGLGITGLFFMFSTHFIVLGGCSATEAIGASFNIVKKKFFPIFGVLFLLGLIQMVSMIPFGLGLILTMPWMLATVYIIFNKTILVHLNEESNSIQNDDILDA